MLSACAECFVLWNALLFFKRGMYEKEDLVQLNGSTLDTMRSNAVTLISMMDSNIDKSVLIKSLGLNLGCAADRVRSLPVGPVE
jgi:hypothetical protein